MAHGHKHDIDATADHGGVSGAVEGNLFAFDANGLPKDSGLASASVLEVGGAGTITALWTFDRNPAAPFGVSSGSAVVTNLDADKLDGYHASAFPRKAENAAITGSWDFQAALTVSQGTLTLGVENATPGAVVAYGVGTGLPWGGKMQFWLAEDYRTPIEFFAIDAWTNDLRFRAGEDMWMAFDGGLDRIKVYKDIEMGNGGVINGDIIGNTGGRITFYTTDRDVRVDDRLGVGTESVPHSGVGGGIVAIEGAYASVADGPHMQFTASSGGGNDYPLIQIWPWRHDHMSINLDCYYDGADKASDAGSSYAIRKADDLLQFRYGVAAAGAVVTLNTAAYFDTSGDFNLNQNLYLVDGKSVGIKMNERFVWDAAGIISVAGAHLLLTSTNEVRFGDDGTKIYQGANSFLNIVADGAVRLTTTGTVDLTVPANYVLEVTGSMFLIDSGFNPRLVLGDSTSANMWGSIRWVSASDAIGIGTDTGGVDTLLVFEDGNARIAGAGEWQFGSADEKIYRGAAGYLDIQSPTATRFNSIIDLVATTSTAGQITQGGERILHLYGANNVFLGTPSGNFTLSGDSNIGLGRLTLVALTSGGVNIALGSLALYRVTSGGSNIGIGWNAGAGLTTTNANTFIGSRAGERATGTESVVIGEAAMFQGTSADHNTLIGTRAGFTGTTFDNNVFIGYKAGFYETGSSKLFIDNAVRADEADGRVKALVYGVFAAAIADQSLLVNGLLKSSYGASFGDGGTTDYFEHEADGTAVMRGAATAWEDIFFPVAYARVPAANAPTWTTFQGNLKEYTFGTNDFIEFGAQEIAHSYKEGTDLVLHIHWVTNGLEGVDRAVRWEIEYTIADALNGGGVGDVFPNTTVESAEQVIPASTPDRSHMHLTITTIDGSAFEHGATIKFRLRRIANTGGEDEPAADPFALQVGIHIEMDTIGSRTETTK